MGKEPLKRLFSRAKVSGTGVRGLMTVVFLAAALLAGVSGCGPTDHEKPAQERPPLSAAEITAKAELAISEYMASLHLSEEEVIFSVTHSVVDGKVALTGRTSEAGLKQGLIDAVSIVPGVSIVDKVEVLPPASMGDKVFAIVNVAVVNLGDGPKSAGGSHTVTQARMGDVLRLLDKSDGWYLGQMDDNYLGWVGPESVFLCDAASTDSFRTSPVVLVIAKTARLLDKPAGASLFEDDLVEGSVLAVIGEEGEWIRVEVPGGRIGWVEASRTRAYADIEEAFAEKKGAEVVIATAKKYVGLPYLWGGTTAYGFDCSGLTQFAMKMNGYRIRRDAGMQYEEGDIVETRADLRPGDLVFFETYAKGASHVGIYLGDSRYIQSGGKTGLTIQSFDPSHPDYSATLDKAYLGARRIID